jgi:hypothetical protein
MVEKMVALSRDAATPKLRILFQSAFLAGTDQ